MRLLQLISTFVFALCAAGTLYTYILYPFLLDALARVFGSVATPPALADDALPTVSLLIAAHDEEAVIAERIENALRLRYPREKLRIIIASDGSTDQTPRIVREYENRGVRLIHDSVQRGKAAVLRSAFANLQSDLVLLSDANTFIEPDAAGLLARWFQDPTVGIVCGRLVLTDPVSGKNADSLYWRYETFLKVREGRIGGLLGANGAIYAIRRSVFQPIPDNTIVDDFVIPLLAKLKSGCRIVYDAAAIAREETAPDVNAEFRRRSRIGAGGWQAIVILRSLLNPANGPVAFTFFSHKVLRWLCPFFLLWMLIFSAAMWNAPFWRAMFLLQVLFYAVSFVGGRLPGKLPGARLLRAGNMFLMMNAALFVGFLRWLTGPQTGMWSRTARGVEQ